MESAFGRSFAEVRVHPDSSRAGGSTHAVTEGRDIHFAPGRYEPGSERGDWLISHELAHVIQQTSHSSASAVPSGPALEADADHAANAVMAGQRPAVQFSASFGMTQAFSETESHDPADASLEEPGDLSAQNSEHATPQAPVAQDTVECAGTAIDAQDGQPAEDGVQSEQSADADPQKAAMEERSQAAEADTVPRQGDGAVHEASSDGAVQAQGPSAGGVAGTGSAAGVAASQAPTVSITAQNPGAIINSLARVPASQAIPALAQAEAASPAALESQRDVAQQSLPEIATPTGLPAKKGKTQADTTQVKSAPAFQSAKENIKPQQSGTTHNAADRALVDEAPAVSEPASTQLAGGDSGTDADGKPKQDPALARSAQGALATVSMPAGQVSTKAKGTPSVDLSGEANPGQLDSALDASSQQTRQAAAEARQAIGQDFGENDIFPEPDDEVLTAGQELGTPQLPQGGNAAPNGLPAEAMASIDAEASPVLHERIGAEQQKYTQGKAQYDADSQAAHQKARQDISELEQSTAATQQDAQLSAQSDVSLARQDWQSEIEQVQTDFQTKAGAARSEHQQQIQTRQTEGNQRASQHIADAERKAEAETRKAKSEVESKKRDAKKESGGFWGWVKSKAKALVDGLKKAVNFIYDNLRKAVKALFEAAKKLALAAIELARKAIVGLIKAYGAILKTFVNIALAAFPKLRDKINKRIDQAVTKATQIVNKAADALKKGVTAIIDFLASTIDKVLGLIQDLYNGILTVIGMLISGELQELIERLATSSRPPKRRLASSKQPPTRNSLAATSTSRSRQPNSSPPAAHHPAAQLAPTWPAHRPTRPLAIGRRSYQVRHGPRATLASIRSPPAKASRLNSPSSSSR
ncbi:MAG: DUF4157 domain-containing protein [Proteobacteria bacterium]|nr:DUF4157 domain-containing protein [Pseudomonadota bacterium]